MTRKALALAAVLAVALAACTTKAGDKKSGGGPTTLKIGLLYTTGGRGGDLASAVLGSTGLAITAAEERFGVKIETVDADYAGDLARAPKDIERLRQEADAILVATDDPEIGPLVAQVNDVPLVHAFLGNDGLVGDRENVFRLAPSNELSAQTLAEYLADHRGYKRIAVATDTTDFGKEGSADLAGAFAQVGRTPVVNRSFKPGGDIHTLVSEAGDEDAQAMVVWVDSPGEASRIVVEAHRVGFAFQMVLSGNLSTATFSKNASSQVTPVAFRDGMLSVGTWAGPWFRLKRIIDFYTTFQTQNSALAPVQAVSVYDGMLALAAAARAEGVEADGIIAGLESLEDFEGAGVPVTFAPGDHEGIDRDDMAVMTFTKNQDSAGGEFMPEVDTGGGFFTVLSESLELPEQYEFLTATG